MKNGVPLMIIKILIIIFTISFIVIEALIIINGNIRYKGEVDYVIILGAKLYGDLPSPALEERLKVAEEYLTSNPDINVIVSGGKGPDETISEAQAMKTYLVNNGVSEDRIILEDKSTSTYENITYSLDIIKEEDDLKSPRILIASNSFHIFRTKLIANSLDVKAYGLPAKTPPSILVQQYIREFFGVIKFIIFSK